MAEPLDHFEDAQESHEPARTRQEQEDVVVSKDGGDV